MDRGRAAAALLALAACIACATAAPTSSDQTALEVSEGASSGCYYNFQHYGEGDRIMTNEPCLNCTCHNRMLMCYLRVCPFTKAIGQDCTVEKRADQCCPIVTCPDVPVDLLTSTSTSSPAEYGATGLGRLDKYGCSINGKYFPEGSKVPPSPNKPCEHCYCIRNMTTCVMQECTLHVDGCTPIYHKDVCCPVRYSCDHPEDEIPLLDDMTTTIRPTPGFLLTTTTMMPVTQPSQNCVHDDEIVPDGALIKTEKACEHCYCMKGDIVCVVQECGTPMENEGKNCTSLPPRQGQCCPDTYICEGDEASTEETTTMQDLTTTPPRRLSVEGSGYRLEPDETYTEIPSFGTEEEGSGEEHLSTVPVTDKSFEKPTETKETATTHDIYEISTESEPITYSPELEDSEKQQTTTEALSFINEGEQVTTSPKEYITSVKEDDHLTTSSFITMSEEIMTTETPTLQDVVTAKVEKTTRAEDILDEATLKEDDLVPEKEHKVTSETEQVSTTPVIIQEPKTTQSQESTTSSSVEKLHTEDIITPEIETQTIIDEIGSGVYTTTPTEKFDIIETTSINPLENEIHESELPLYSPGRIPGEGDCLLNSITYQNNSVVPSTNNCHTTCRCISSIIKCEPIVCSAPPEYMNDCQPIYDSPESCCPTYVCSTKETIPPESHNQMSESESAKPVLPSECSSAECESSDDKLVPSDCSNNNCVPKDKVTSQDTAVPCDGEKCKADSSLEIHPDLHHDEPAECSAKKGCTKPVDTQTGNDCSGENCNVQIPLECTGTDCSHEIKIVTSPEESATSPAYVTNKLTEKPDTTEKIGTLHGFEKDTDTSTQSLNIETQPIDEYVIPIKTSSEKPQTESTQSQDVTSSYKITKTPEHSATLVDNVQTEPSIASETESDMSKQPQSTLEPVTTDSDNTVKDVPQGTSGQTTTSLFEQAVTESQTVTIGAYETKPTEETGATYSPEPNNETIIPAIDQVNEINEDIIKDTTESVLKETTTSQGPIPSESVQEDNDIADISGPTISHGTTTEKIESSTLSYPTGTESDHKPISELDEHYTEKPSSLGYEEKDQTTEPVSSITVSNIKITDADDIKSDEYKPVSDETESEVTGAPEIRTELPLTEGTKSSEPESYTTGIPKLTEKSEEHYTTEGIEEHTQTSFDEQQVTKESTTTDAKITDEKQTTEAQFDKVTSSVLRDKENESTMTEAIPTETLVGDVTLTESSETKQETSTSVPEIKTTEIKTSTESGYHYQPTSPGFDVTAETTILPLDEVPIKIATESEPSVTSGTVAPEITEAEIQDSKELTTTRPQDIVTSEHKYYTTEANYQPSSQTSVDKDLSEKLDITTVSPIIQEEKTTTTGIHEELTSTARVDIETNKDDEQRVSVEDLTPPNYDTTTNKVSFTDTISTTDKYETVHPSVNTQPETDTKLKTTEASIQFEDTQTTESEIKLVVDDALDTSTEPHTDDVKPYTEKIESDIPTNEVTYTEEASTRIPSNEITEKPYKGEEMEQEKNTEISEPVTVVSEKAETTTTRIIEIETPEKDSVPGDSTVIPGTSEYGAEEPHTDTPFITTLGDLNVEIVTEKKDKEETDTEHHAEIGSGEEDTITSSPTATKVTQNTDLEQEIITSEIFTSSSATETPIEEIDTIKEHIQTIPATFERTTQNIFDIQKETSSPSVIESVTVAIDAHDISAETMSSIDGNTLQTREPDGVEPEISTEKTIKESTELLPEHDDSQSGNNLETSTTISIYEEMSTPHSVLSLVTDETEKEGIKPHTDFASSIPVQEKDTLTTEPLSIDKGQASTEKIVTKEPEILTTSQQGLSEHGQMTSSDEEIYNTNLIRDPEVITEYPEKTTAGQILNEDNEISHFPDVSQTILPETTYDSQSVTKESTPSQILYESTTQRLLEEETDKKVSIEEPTTQRLLEEETDKKDSIEESTTKRLLEEGTDKKDSIEESTTQKLLEEETDHKDSIQETTKSPIKYDADTTTSVLLETEPEKQITTKETLPDINEYGTTLSVETETYREQDSLVTETPSILATKQTAELPEQTENVPETSTHADISQDVPTSISPNTISDKDMESQSPISEQAIPSKDDEDIITTVPIEIVTEKETEVEESTKTEVSSVTIEEQTEKEILREPSKDMLESSTLVTMDKEEDIIGTFVTTTSTDSSSYESTTLKTLKDESEYVTVAQQTTEEEKLYTPTTLPLPEKDADKEIDSGIHISTETTLDTSLTTSGATSSTPTNKSPESTDDVQKSTEHGMDYPETTPYLIELQEHPHQPIDESSSKMPIDADLTTEEYISEHPDRGDIPHSDEKTTLNEDKSSTTPQSIHDEILKEVDQTTVQSPSEIPKEEDRYTVLPIETEKPLATPETHTEKHIPDDNKPQISDDVITSSEEIVSATMPPVFTKPSQESTHAEELDKPEEKPVEPTEITKPELNEPSDDLPSPDFPPSGAGGYGQEPDYGESEDQAFGPGTCRYGGKVYVSAQQIPRDDPCDFCFCFRSDIICLQQSCPPPIHGCHEEPIQGFCCPRYECPVSMATTLNVTTTTTTTTTTLPPHFLPHAYKGAAQRRGCQIKGHTYKVGEVVRASSGPCLHCTCGGDGQMKCDPKACTPEPMLRQMIAAAVSAKRRR